MLVPLKEQSWTDLHKDVQFIYLIFKSYAHNLITPTKQRQSYSCKEEKRKKKMDVNLSRENHYLWNKQLPCTLWVLIKLKRKKLPWIRWTTVLYVSIRVMLQISDGRLASMPLPPSPKAAWLSTEITDGKPRISAGLHDAHVQTEQSTTTKTNYKI